MPGFSPCVLAVGTTYPDGYVYIPRVGWAHRVAWSRANGRPIPPGMKVCHTCDNPSCWNPEHLFLGTHGDNMQDMVKKGRHPSAVRPELRQGERQGNAKLTDSAVREIRARYAAGETNKAALGREYGVSAAAIYLVVTRRQWSHV